MVAWSADKIRLVALQNRWFKQRQYIQGTWIVYALGLIRDTRLIRDTHRSIFERP
jgi:hypothetical protein